MGYGKGLMQIEMTDVGTNDGGARQTNLGVHVGAVHVHLSPVRVNHRTHLGHALFEHSVRRGIRDHERGEVRIMCLGQPPQVGDGHVTGRIALHHHDPHPCQHRAGGVGPMRGRGNQHDVAMRFIPRALIRADRHQPGVFALCPRVWLQ